ncbi:M20/M25/M40 family metallo-hydrolase [Sporolactobacillus shoreicorticis]|uniref:M20/M25/M40 family metallo-hydrolase n=1 Tax=Sporolactobacillus shoreicorticis TaxID=1923877 RepID=A0ABW5S5W9_9BACL|nr:M20/M25/M40 family metallo-hydrolase [Sporolactobacillus shoreicorticis]MCO7128141.1 M20/M25/M40 family metallo-hydrolase [Sporolactobacillus shoreicorticis]
MYELIKDLPAEEQIEKIARDLVSVKSVNGTDGEVAMAKKLEAILRSFPYFKQHPENVWTQALDGDKLGRKNVFALLKNKNETKKTIIYHGHMDTVGVDDFGSIEYHALDSDYLQNYFSSYVKDTDVQSDAQSGDWLFGRGALDMKSGDAVHLSNLLHYTEHPEELNGNLLVMFNPVEENDHEGAMEAVGELLRLREEQGLDYAVAINTDFNSPLYHGDQKRYIYTGSAGKLLGCFYIRGRETHVGETLSGIDPTLIASKINNALNNNMAYAEQISGEVILPASCLYQRDQKVFYNVQTAGAVRLYFNYFLYERTPEDVLEQLKGVAKQTCDELADFLKNQYRVFADNCGLQGEAPDWTTDVLSFSEFVQSLEARSISVKEIVDRVVEANPNEDSRQVSFKIIEKLEEASGDQRPKVIVFFAPPYCPHNYLRQEVEAEHRVNELLDQVLSETSKVTGEQFAKKRFFPYLADGSYLSMSETAEETSAILNNFPGWGKTYSVPLDPIRKLNIPVLDMGVYGKKAHTWKERVYKPYSYRVLPTLIRSMTECVLEDQKATH